MATKLNSEAKAGQGEKREAGDCRGERCFLEKTQKLVYCSVKKWNQEEALSKGTQEP